MKAKVTLLIGHRGVGKSSLLNRLQSYFKEQAMPAQTIDLDEYIETKANKSIADIFENEGEAKFRELEVVHLNELVKNAHTRLFISAGAGFLGPYPDGVDIVHVKRQTDQNGRVFLDRPRLKKNLSAFMEYINLYSLREQHYQKHCHRSLCLQEGLVNNSDYENLFFGLTKKNIGGLYTLFSKDITNIKKILDWGVDKLELRTDLLPKETISDLIKKLPSDKLLLSIRNKNIDLKAKYMDWDTCLGAPNQNFHIISSHKKFSTFDQTIKYLEQYSSQCDHLKLAIPIDSIDELIKYHEWHLLNPTKNAFLPMSDDGKFSWYRLIQKNNVYPNFFKTTGSGSAQDQPFFYDWALNNFKTINGFAAIIGYPVIHSWTPNYHYNFFKQRDMPVIKINLSEDELTTKNLDFLTKLGLRAGAVTSPLKIKMKELVKNTKDKAVNTIVFKDKIWHSTSTDGFGFKKVSTQLTNSEPMVLWGAGGVISAVKESLPNVVCYSARTGQPRDGFLKVKSPQAVIWGVGRKLHQNWPNSSWKPKVIVDLNYSEDSPGKEYALMVGAEYISGESMFVGQALKQQEFWSNYLDA